MAPRIKRYADSVEVREWAMSLSEKEKKDLGIEGIEVSTRGRFHSKLVNAFNRVHRAQGVRYVPIGRNQPRLPDVFEDADQGDDNGPTVYRQPRQPQAAEEPEQAPAEAGAAFTGAPAPVLDLLRNSKTPVVVVYVPMAV